MRGFYGSEDQLWFFREYIGAKTCELIWKKTLLPDVTTHHRKLWLHEIQVVKQARDRLIFFRPTMIGSYVASKGDPSGNQTITGSYYVPGDRWTRADLVCSSSYQHDRWTYQREQWYISTRPSWLFLILQSTWTPLFPRKRQC
jgi:hypothetical protein